MSVMSIMTVATVAGVVSVLSVVTNGLAMAPEAPKGHELDQGHQWGQGY